MIRDEFIQNYMSRSKISDYRVDGERVYWGGRDRFTLALPCRCGEEGCEGWAMVPPSGREWHLWQNDVEGSLPTYEEAIEADMAFMRAEDAR
jgi:hypothetical protein